MASTEPPAEGPSDEQLTAVVLRVLAAVVVLLAAGGIASAAARLAEDDDPPPAPTAMATADLSPRGGLGPLPGTAVATYRSARDTALAEADRRTRRVAVVSFARYVTPEAARSALGDTEPVRLLLALPGGRPTEAAVGTDVAAMVKAQRAEAAAEKKALEQLLPTVRDPEFRAQYEVDLERLRRLLAGGADEREVVFGAVVIAPVPRLRALRATPMVRLVDLGDGSTAPSGGTIVGIRPEETSQAGDPPVRPAPEG